MKKTWEGPKLRNLTSKDTYSAFKQVQCSSSICISKCEVCGGCIGSSTKVQLCSYYKNLIIEKCVNVENGGCRLPLS